MEFELDYDRMIHLDAEDLAEGGIAEAYDLLLPELRQHVANPQTLEERLDNSVPHYSILSGTKEFTVYSSTLDMGDGRTWGLATYALFTIVNDQLTSSDYKLYAINAGNDLGGFFLSEEQAQAAQKTLPRKVDWPYLPTNQHPWYGMHHD